MRKTLTEQQKRFIEAFTSEARGNASKSAKIAGYKHAKVQGYQLKNQLAKEIEEANRKQLSSSVPLAIQTLRDLIESETTPSSTKLGAVNSILDRNSYSAQYSKTEDMTNKKSDEQLEQELEYLLKSLKAVPVIQVQEEEEEIH